SLSAAMARIGWPTKRGSFVRISSCGGGIAGTSAAVRLPKTPGIASASSALMFVTRACGIGLVSSLQKAMPSARKSSAYFARPVTFASRSGGTKSLPISGSYAICDTPPRYGTGPGDRGLRCDDTEEGRHRHFDESAEPFAAREHRRARSTASAALGCLIGGFETRHRLLEDAASA